MSPVGALETVEDLLVRFGLSVVRVANGQAIPASFWGEPEAGVEGHAVYVRDDTPLHSILHEACHIICMTPARRATLYRDAGGDDLEESAVCYLQVLLAEYLQETEPLQLMQAMDEWGYSFRLGDTRSWFERDASDARDWLIRRGIIDLNERPTWALRS